MWSNIRHVRPDFLFTIRNKWHTRPDKNILNAILGKNFSVDPEPEFLELIKVVLSEYRHARHGLPLPKNREIDYRIRSGASSVQSNVPFIKILTPERWL
jgi:hypothetical protein